VRQEDRKCEGDGQAQAGTHPMFVGTPPMFMEHTHFYVSLSSVLSPHITWAHCNL